MYKNLRFTVLFFLSLNAFVLTGNPRTDVLVFDMDEVLVEKESKLSLYGSVLFECASTLPGFMYRMATDSNFRNKVQKALSMHNPDQNKAYGVTFKLATIACFYPPMRKIFDALINTIFTKRRVVKPVINLLKKYKDQGYTLFIATNRERIGYEITARALNFDLLYNGKPLFDKIITGGDGDIVKATTTIRARRFSTLQTDPRLDGTITEAQAFKPNKEYYIVVRNTINNFAAEHPERFDTLAPRIIFFDDKQENIDGANRAEQDIAAFTIPQDEARRAIIIRSRIKSAIR